MAEAKLQFSITAKDQASATLKNVGDSVSKVGKVIAGAMAAAGASVVAFGVSSVKAYSQSQAQMAKMDTVLKNLGGSLADNKKKIMEAAEATKKLGFDDDDAAQSITSLFTRTKDLTKSIQLNTMAMDLARYKNISLADASEKIGQVVSGNGKALKEFGIILKEGVDPLDALKEAHQSFTGVAQASSGTMEVSLERIKNSFGDFQKSVGKVISDSGLTTGLVNLANLLSNVLTFDTDKATQKVNTFIATLKSMFVSFEEKTGVIEFFKFVWDGLVTLFVDRVKPVWDELIQTIYKNRDVLIQISEGFIKFIAIVGGGILLTTLSLITGAIKLMDIAISFLVATIDKLGTAFAWIIETAPKVYEWIKKIANLGIDKVAGASSGGASRVSGARASGGSVMSGNSYLVGEKGPEIFTPMASGNIIPNNRIGGGTTVVVNMNGGTYLSRDVAQTIGDMIVDNLKYSARLSV